MRIVGWIAAGVTVLAVTHAAGGQSVARSAVVAAPDADGVIKPSTTGVVKPGSVVDPGMTVIHPKVPSASTPVIKPKTTTPDGSVVVPK